MATNTNVDPGTEDDQRIADTATADTRSAMVTGPDTGRAVQKLLASLLVGLLVGPECSITGVLARIEGNDIIDAGVGSKMSTDFNVGNSRAITDGNQANNDFIDLSSFYIDQTDLRNDVFLDDAELNHSVGDYADNTAILGSIEMQSIAATDATFDNTNVVCFASDTRITTHLGERTISDVQVGDLILTRDNGFQKVRWIGVKTVVGEGHHAPILIREGALGNTRDLRVLPQHKMILKGWQAELLFGEYEVLAAAKMLVNDLTIRAVPSAQITYVHVLFDDHEIICAEGCWSESFHPSVENVASLDCVARGEVLELVPELRTNAQFGSTRFSLKAHEAASFMARLA